MAGIAFSRTAYEKEGRRTCAQQTIRSGRSSCSFAISVSLSSVIHAPVNFIQHQQWTYKYHLSISELPTSMYPACLSQHCKNFSPHTHTHTPHPLPAATFSCSSSSHALPPSPRQQPCCVFCVTWRVPSLSVTFCILLFLYSSYHSMHGATSISMLLHGQPQTAYGWA